MKKLLLWLCTVSALMLASCAPREGNPFSYQKMPAIISGTLSSDTGAYEVEIKLGAVTDASARCAEIKFTSPETLSGISVDVNGGTVTASSGNMTVPVSPEAASGWMSVLELFCIEPDGVSSVTENESGVVVSTEEAEVFFRPGETLPYMIKSENRGLSLAIDKYEIIETETEKESDPNDS